MNLGPVSAPPLDIDAIAAMIREAPAGCHLLVAPDVYDAHAGDLAVAAASMPGQRITIGRSPLLAPGTVAVMDAPGSNVTRRFLAPPVAAPAPAQAPPVAAKMTPPRPPRPRPSPPRPPAPSPPRPRVRIVDT
jgi:hypothetical protein